jgi:hypothetical protein
MNNGVKQMSANSSAREILVRAEQYGIDLSLLRERLHWTPTERIERHQAALALAEALRHAKSKPPTFGRRALTDHTEQS